MRQCSNKKNNFEIYDIGGNICKTAVYILNPCLSRIDRTRASPSGQNTDKPNACKNYDTIAASLLCSLLRLTDRREVKICL